MNSAPAEGCISCATVSGLFVSPGGVIYENSKWIVVLKTNPVRFPCLPLLILKRHCEVVAELDKEESSSLGQLIQLTARAVDEVLQPAKIHFGIYAEEVKHIHVHVFPRMPNMPAGNIPNLWIEQWMNLMHAVGLRQSYSNQVVAEYARALQRAYLSVAQ